jgi:NDP-sugar pyrophosphorylase family protein
VINSDVLTKIDFSKLLSFHAEHCANATVCVRNHETLIPYGVVNTEDGQVYSFVEKPVLKHYVNAGIYVITPDLLDLLPVGGPIDMPQLLELALKEKLSVAAFPIHEYWIDAGLPETFEQANGDWG